MITPGNVTGDRERVLASIRQATQAGAADAHDQHPVAPPDRSRYAQVLPRVADAWEEKLAVFRTRCEGLRTKLHVVDDLAALQGVVRDILAEEGAKRVAFHQHPLVTPVVEQAGVDTGVESVCVDGGYDAHALESCQVGLTGCFALIAQTGSVMVTSQSTGGRALSVLPPHHVVLATAEDLVTDLPTAYAKFIAVANHTPTSMLSLISGPSRTGDIERILVLGAHGPKRLTIILKR